MREALKQPQYQPIPVAEQIAILLAVTSGLLDDLPVERVGEAANLIRHATLEELPNLCSRIEGGEKLEDEDRQSLLETARRVIRALAEEAPVGNA